MVRIYGLIAVLIVLIPEWLAEFVLFIGHSNHDKQLPRSSTSWQTEPELRLAAMNMRELRLLAMELKIHGYANESKDTLSWRIKNALQLSQINPLSNMKF